MLTRAEAERIAASGSALRPEWSPGQILAVLGDQRIRVHRTPSDTAAALARLALDPETRQPTRLLESGPWWTTNATEHNTSAHIRRATDLDCATCGHPETTCTGRADGHEFEAAGRRRAASAPVPQAVRDQLATPPPRPEPPAPKAEPRSATETLATHGGNA